MRKITEDAIRAFRNNQDFEQGNTQVFSNSSVDDYDLRTLKLFKNSIAWVDNDGCLWISSCGHMTVTTKERLNGFPTVNIVQKNWVWYLNGEEWDGRAIKVDW